MAETNVSDLILKYTNEGIKNSFQLFDEIQSNEEFFIYVDDEIIQTNILFASFISPNISRNILIDRTCQSFEIQVDRNFDDFKKYCQSLTSLGGSSFLTFINDKFELQLSKTMFKSLIVEKLNDIFEKTKKYEIFEYILNISQSFLQESNDLSTEFIFEYFVLIKIFSSFGNAYIVKLLADPLFKIFNENQKIENEIKLLKMIQIKELISNGNIDSTEYTKEIEYIQKNFIQMNPETINKINEYIIEISITDESFQIPDEDNFFYQIIKLKDEYKKYFIHFVELQNLSDSAINLFIQMIHFSEIDAQLWNQITTRILIPTDKNDLLDRLSRSKRYQKEHHTFINGIFNHLNNICEGNAHLKGLIEITSNGDSFHNCYNIIDKNFESFFYPYGGKDTYIQIDFKKFKVSLASYSLKSMKNTTNKLINWEIVGSNDLKNWKQIDERHINEWGGNYNEASYTVDDNNQQMFRYFQLRLKGKDSSNENYIDLSSIEFFGTIYENK